MWVYFGTPRLLGLEPQPAAVASETSRAVVDQQQRRDDREVEAHVGEVGAPPPHGKADMAEKEQANMLSFSHHSACSIVHATCSRQ